jgi:segregation and condensation protein B
VEVAGDQELLIPDGDRQKAVLEALIFASEQPVSEDRVAAILGGVTKKEVRSLVDELNEEYRSRGRAFEIVEIAQGYQVRTRAEFSGWIAKLRQQRVQRISRPALESLAIIAYRQPVTRAEIESIRGVDAGGVLGSLLERKLIRILGRKEVPGRPILYGTTAEFLELFGLKNLSTLPTLRELEGMFKQESLVEELAPLDVEKVEGQGAGADEEPSSSKGGEGTGLAGEQALSAEEEAPDEVAEVTGTSGQESAGGDWDTREMDAILRTAKTKVKAFEGEDLGKGSDGVLQRGGRGDRLDEVGKGADVSSGEKESPGADREREPTSGE